jgi:hypothetical protein
MIEATSHIADSIWRQYVKIMWPTLAEGSEEYQTRKKCFMCGINTALGLVQKGDEQLLIDVYKEVRAELGLKGKKAIITGLNGN